MQLYDRINESVNFIKSRAKVSPEVGVVLGSGLGEFADTLEEKTVIPYEEIPHFKKVSVVGHAVPRWWSFR